MQELPTNIPKQTPEKLAQADLKKAVDTLVNAPKLSEDETRFIANQIDRLQLLLKRLGAEKDVSEKEIFTTNLRDAINNLIKYINDKAEGAERIWDLNKPGGIYNTGNDKPSYYLLVDRDQRSDSKTAEQLLSECQIFYPNLLKQLLPLLNEIDGWMSNKHEETIKRPPEDYDGLTDFKQMIKKDTSSLQQILSTIN